MPSQKCDAIDGGSRDDNDDDDDDDGRPPEPDDHCAPEAPGHHAGLRYHAARHLASGLNRPYYHYLPAVLPSSRAHLSSLN